MENKDLHKQEVLLSQVAAGDQLAFSQLFRQYMPSVYRHLLLWVKNKDTADELVQDIFMAVWKNRAKLVNMENFPGYLYVITRNRALKAFRELVDDTEEPPEDMIQTLLQGPEANMEYKDLQRILHQGISQMPKRRKEVFKLSRIEQLTYREIADQLEISTNAVKLHIVEALIFLRTFMKEKADSIVAWLLAWLIYHS